MKPRFFFTVFLLASFTGLTRLATGDARGQGFAPEVDPRKDLRSSRSNLQRSLSYPNYASSLTPTHRLTLLLSDICACTPMPSTYEHAMLGGLLLKVLNRLRRFVVDVDCPACRHRFKPHADRPLVHWREFFARVPCPKCGYEMEIGEKKMRAANPPGAVNKPRKTKIQRHALSPDELEFFLPAGKVGAGLIGIGAVVCAVMLPVVYFTVIRGQGFAQGVNAPRVILSLISLAGIGMLYGGLRQRFATYRIYLGPQWLCVRRNFLLRWTSKLPTRAIESVRRDEAYAVASGSDSSMEEVYKCHAIQVQAGFRTIRFGSGLTDQEQLWLAQEIRAYLHAHGATGLAKDLPPTKSA